MENNLTKKLSKIQAELNAPKKQYNSFGKYKYRSCEDILEAVKPMLGEAVIILNDSIEVIGGRFYLCSKAEFRIGNDSISSIGIAREPDTQKGMSSSQVTGSAASYARKYALGGLLAIDDSKDVDSKGKAPVNEEKQRLITAIGRTTKTTDLRKLEQYAIKHNINDVYESKLEELETA